MQMTTIESEELLLRMKKGSTTAYHLLWDRYYGAVFVRAFRHTGCLHTARDITQECFATLWNKRETITAKNIGPYLDKMVKNLVIDYRRSRKTRTLTAEKWATQQQVSTYSNPAECMEIRTAIRSELAALPQQQRAVARGYYQEGLDLQELSLILRLHITSIKTYLSQATMKLRARLTHLR
jgi:RNA polymerase sigma-70 factor (ECF subfamily)